MIYFNNNNPSTHDLAIFTRQLATMQSAGVPLLRALQIISNSNHKPAITRVVIKLKNKLEAGHSFANALASQAGFDALFVNLIAIGESSGELDQILQNLASYKEKAASLKSKINSALYYPCIVLSITLLVSIILLVKVVPIFQNMFEGLGAKLPAATQFVLMLSQMLQQHTLLLLIIAIVLVSLIKHYSAAIIFKAPILGAIMRKIIVSRFARTLAITINAGMPLQQALLLIAKASNNIQYHKAIIAMHDNISAGQSIHAAMRMTKLFPNMAMQMIAIGEETATLDSMLKKVASIYEEEIDLAMEQLTTLLEPLLMLMLGIIVGSLVIAMYMPIFNLGAII